MAGDPDPSLPPRCPASSGSAPSFQPEEPPAVAAPDALGSTKKVRFAAVEDLLHPAPQKLIHGAPKPCLKTASAAAFKADRRVARTAASSSPVSCHASSIEPPSAEASPEDGWKLIRAPYWWRALPANHRHPRRRSPSSFSPPTGRNFVKHRRRTCHRCLEQGHCKIDCRDPYKCLICRRSGHRARQCTSKSPPSSQDCVLSPPTRRLPPSALVDERIEPRSHGVEPGAPSRRADHRHREYSSIRGRHDDDRSSGCARPRARCVSPRNEEIRGRSPSPSPRTTQRDIIVLRPSPTAPESCGRSSPPSPRTTHRDIIELRPSLTATDCLRRAAPCLGLQVAPEDAPPGWPARSPPCLLQRATSPTPSPLTPLHRPAPSPVLDWRWRVTCLGSEVQPSHDLEVINAAAAPGARAPPSQATAPPAAREATTSPWTPEVGSRILSPGSDAAAPIESSGASTPVFVAAMPSFSPPEALHALTVAATTSMMIEDTPCTPDRQALDVGDSATPIFIPRLPALLPTPSPRSTPPRPPKARRKTLAGVTGFQLQRRSPRLQSKNRTMPIARLAEQLLCHRMGIIPEGDQVTEDAIAKFAAMFQGRLPDITIAALRALFKLDCDLASAVEEALVQHGGDGGPGLDESAGGEAAVGDA